MEAAINKMTGHTAHVFGLVDRGVTVNGTLKSAPGWSRARQFGNYSPGSHLGLAQFVDLAADVGCDPTKMPARRLNAVWYDEALE